MLTPDSSYRLLSCGFCCVQRRQSELWGFFGGGGGVGAGDFLRTTNGVGLREDPGLFMQAALV